MQRRRGNTTATLRPTPSRRPRRRNLYRLVASASSSLKSLPDRTQLAAVPGAHHRRARVRVRGRRRAPVDSVRIRAGKTTGVETRSREGNQIRKMFWFRLQVSACPVSRCEIGRAHV